jgi:hypothetical protein
MAFAVGVPTNDPKAEAKIAEAYANDPGASINGKYMNATEGVAAAANFPHIRLITVGNVHDCKEPIIDFFPSGTNDSTHPLAHPWAVASPTTVGLGKDVMGGTSCTGPLCFSATCWYYGMELQQKLKIPIGLVHSSYGRSKPTTISICRDGCSDDNR